MIDETFPAGNPIHKIPLLIYIQRMLTSKVQDGQTRVVDQLSSFEAEDNAAMDRPTCFDN